jgi:hypothetical protein
MPEQSLPNIYVLLEKIEDLVDSVPCEQNDRIDWNKLKQQKEGARLALNSLFIMLSEPGTDSIHPCPFGNPKK